MERRMSVAGLVAIEALIQAGANLLSGWCDAASIGEVGDGGPFDEGTRAWDAAVDRLRGLTSTDMNVQRPMPESAKPACRSPAAAGRAGECDGALREIWDEYREAIGKWPPFNSAHEGYAVIKEELDELWEAVRAGDVEAARREAVHIGAMAVRFIAECDDGRPGTTSKETESCED